MTTRFKASLLRRFRSALVRHARGQPRRRDRAGAHRRVTFVLTTAWGMGGTIRTTLNLAGHLAARGYEVEILSVGRTRDVPFFAPFPEGVKVTPLDDKRPGKEPSLLHPLRRSMRHRDSLFMHPDDRAARSFNLWVDWRLVRALHRRCGFLITTRPGLNLIAAELAPPGLVLVGQEHMNLREHTDRLRRAIRRRYDGLDVLSVLTERDRRRYTRHLRGRIPIVRVPNSVRDMGGVRADVDAKIALAAGRFAYQKGFDRLVKAWSRLASDHPDWRLRICGDGPMQTRLEELIDSRGLQQSVSLEPAAADLGAEMAKSSVFVLSSRWEGLPLVLLEAMSAGMTVVSFDCPTGPADVIDDHRDGLLIRPRTIAALEAGLREVIEAPELRRRCAAGALEKARQYSVEAIGERWEEVLRELAHERLSYGPSP